MRDNNRKPGPRRVPEALGRAGVVLIVAAAAAFTAATVAAQEPARLAGKACAIAHATLGETGQPTGEITTDQMEVVLAQIKEGVLVIDARPYEEFAMSHISGAVNVAPKPGLSISQFTSDVGEIGKLTQGKKNGTIVLYCNGPFCGKSKRLATDLLAAGYTHVVRYQLGIPVWRALGHPTQAEADAIRATIEKDRTAVVIDAREPDAFQAGSIPGSRNVRFADVAKAKDDGRLPMLDHNTRIFVVGKDEAEARAAAQEIARNAFHNVSFFAGPIEALMQTPKGSGSR
jgi:rhodanese-related sulfurtransferase